VLVANPDLLSPPKVDINLQIPSMSMIYLQNILYA